MLTFIRQLTKLPPIEDTAQIQLVRTLHYILLLAIIISSAYGVLALPFADDISGPAISGVMTVVFLFLFWQLRLGRYQLVSISLIMTSYLAIMASLVVNGGLRDEAALVMIAVLALGGFFLGVRAAIALGGISAFAFIGLYIAERTGWITETEHFQPVAGDELMVALIATATTTFIMQQILGRIISSSQQIQKQAASLRRKNNVLQKTRTSLAKRTVELTTALTNLQETQHQLITAKDQAEIANHAKSEFLSNMSHELRTPLNSIMGFAQLLTMEKNLSPGQLEKLNIIHRSGEHLLTLINDVLDISRIEARKLELVPMEINLPGFLREIVDTMSVRAKERNLEFIFDRADNLPEFIQADEKRLRQVLINMLANAIKYTLKGEVIFRIDRVVHPEKAPSLTKLRFEVVDTGVGIPATDLERIFIPFEQVKDDRVRVEGTGLGLAISHQLVQLMGSQLKVKSKPGRGSRFWFEVAFPLGGNVQTVNSYSYQSIRSYTGRRRKALVADDKPENRIFMINLLRSLGFEVEGVENGLHCVERARQLIPDVIFMDTHMPVMSGLVAVRKIRAVPAIQSCLIIAVSADVFQGNREKSLAAGCDLFLPKPIDVRELVAILSERLAIQWQMSEGSQLLV